MDKYFLSKAHMHKFALDVLEGEGRMKLLNINFSLFTDQKKAKKWHDDILKELQKGGLDDMATVEKDRKSTRLNSSHM